MAQTGTSPRMADSDITAMKETLRAQQQLLQKLHAELDQEREASASAASEAMDMILRLQGEKAAVKMEASHFKRMAEEKIDHAEASLEVLEELLYEKEMEIAALEYQILAYKHKLLALGVDFTARDFEFPDDLLSNRNDQQNGETDQSSSLWRLNSLPAIQFKSTLRAVRKRERSASPPSVPVPVSDPIPKTAESGDHEDLANGSLDSYWNQIKRLDEKVNVISDCKESGGDKYPTPNLRIRRGRSCSVYSLASTKTNYDQTAVPSTNASRNSREGTHDREVVVSTGNVHDVFEVPQTSEKHEVSEHGKKRLEKWISDSDNRLTKPDSASDETVETHVKHDNEKLKGRLTGHHDRKIPNPKDMKAIVWQKKEGGVDADCNSQVEFQKLHRRIERLERERITARQEITHEGDREEQLRLLKDIHSQLKLIQSEMKSLKTEKATTKEDVPLEPLQKAMLYFWI